MIAVASDLRGTARREIDATGEYVLPGLLDVHTHPLYVNDVTSLSRSAAYGGITTVIYYAYAERGRSAITTAKEAVEVIAQAKARGWRVYGETCPQYLTLTGEEIFRQGPLAKIGPPLRRKEDQEALWRGLTQGVLDVIASDHAPKEKKKTDDFFQAAYGSPQVETMVEVVYETGVNGGKITLPRLVQVMSENPAKIFGLYPRKGALAVGSDADLVIFDPQLEHTITGEEQHSNAPYTLYEGWRCLGRPVFSLQRGEVILEEGEVVAEAGRGKFLPTQAGKVDPKEHVL